MQTTSTWRAWTRFCDCKDPLQRWRMGCVFVPGTLCQCLCDLVTFLRQPHFVCFCALHTRSVLFPVHSYERSSTSVAINLIRRSGWHALHITVPGAARFVATTAATAIECNFTATVRQYSESWAVEKPETTQHPPKVPNQKPARWLVALGPRKPQVNNEAGSPVPLHVSVPRHRS